LQRGAQFDCEAHNYSYTFKNTESRITLNRGKAEHIKLPLNFRCKFFTYIPGIIDEKYEIIYPDTSSADKGWFAVGTQSPPRPGFGFACNCCLQKLELGSNGRDFKWEVSRTWHLRCLHQVMDETNTNVENEHNFGHVIGSNWFNEIYKTLWGI
jgi:hypothetical protein